MEDLSPIIASLKEARSNYKDYAESFESLETLFAAQEISPTDMSKTKLQFSEKITCAIIELDSLPNLSRQNVIELIQNGNENEARKLCLLLVRKKNVITRFEALADKVQNFQCELDENDASKNKF